MDYLKLLRSIISEKDIKLNNYKASTIRAVLFGQRKNEEILTECIKVALSKIESNKKALNKYIKRIQNNTLENNTKTYTSNKQKANEQKLKSYIDSKQNKPLSLSKKDLEKAVKENEAYYMSLILGVEAKENMLEHEKEERYKKANEIYSKLTQQVKNKLKPILKGHLSNSERYFFDSSKLTL